jgi:biotin synthase
VIAGAETALLDERRLLTGDELAALAALPDGAVMALASLAHQVRLAWCGPEVEIEGILSAKTGGCPEDCHFCSQSSRFDTPVKATPFLDTNEVLAAARETAALGASEFCIVLAVRGPDERTMQRILDLVPVIHDETGLNVAISAGILTEDQARRLAEGGVHRYNHNVETSRSFFPNIVTTHEWDERADTCRLVKAHGMELCCGALINVGETVAQRVELLTQLQELDRPLPPGSPVGDPPLCRRPRSHLARPPGHRHDGRDQCPHRGQLSDDARPLGRRGPPNARGPAHAHRRPHRRHLTRRHLTRRHLIRRHMPQAMTAHCTGCGKPSLECPGCGRALDPPRFCPGCGRRMTVSVVPTGWVARCREPGHPELHAD